MDFTGLLYSHGCFSLDVPRNRLWYQYLFCDVLQKTFSCCFSAAVCHAVITGIRRIMDGSCIHFIFVDVSTFSTTRKKEDIEIMRPIHNIDMYSFKCTLSREDV
jgi:hypothetical protein